MKYVASFVLCIFFCTAAIAEQQMTLGDLYKLCTSSDGSDKVACRFYILGVFEGSQLTGESVQDKSGNLQELKDKRYCVPEGLSSGGMELAVKMRMGPDLAVFPEDRSLPAVSFVTGVMMKDFSCQKK
jgi:hypothetical protein